MSETPKKNDKPEATSAEDALIGELFDGKYRVSKKLGGGGMGLVYEAHHEWMERRVALKVLRPTFIDADEYGIFLERFKREAQTASRISHPNAVTIYDFGIHKQMPYLAMQFIEGTTLTELIKQEGALSEERACALLTQVVEASIAAHAMQIIHRDIKPDNVMITSNKNGAETAHVLDFGIAKVLDNSEASANMTLPGKTVGTPRYMSPEQVLANDIDARTDIYALGLLLYEMLSGDIPFKADSSMQLMFHHVNTAPLPIREVNAVATVSKQVERIIMKALEKEPQKRFQSAEELKEALDELSGKNQNRSSAILTLPASGSVLPRSLSTSGALIAGGVSALLLVFFASYLLTSGPSLQTETSTRKDDTLLASNKNAEPSASEVRDTDSARLRPDAIDSNQAQQVVAEGDPLRSASPTRTESAPTTGATIEVSTADSGVENEDTSNAAAENPAARDDATQESLSGSASKENKASRSNPEARNTSTDSSRSESPAADPSATESAVGGSTVNGPTAVGPSTTEETISESPSRGAATATAAAVSEAAQASNAAAVSDSATEPSASGDDIAENDIQSLIALLAGEDRKARERAAIELQNRGNEPVPALIDTLQNHSSPRARYWAVFILGKLRAKSAVPAMTRALNDPSGMVQEMAKKALQATEPTKASKLLGTTSPQQSKKKSGILGIFE